MAKWLASLGAGNEGITDAEAWRGPGLDRDYPNLIRVPEPILTLEYSAYTLEKPSPARIVIRCAAAASASIWGKS